MLVCVDVFGTDNRTALFFDELISSFRRDWSVDVFFAPRALFQQSLYFALHFLNSQVFVETSSAFPVRLLTQKLKRVCLVFDLILCAHIDFVA